MISVLIVDDHKIVRLGLKALLESDSDFTVVAQAEDGEDAVRHVKTLHPDLVILDLMMPKVDGLTTIERLLALKSPPRIVALTSYTSSDILSQTLSAGAHALVLKTDDDAILLKALHEVAAGRTFCSPEATALIRSDPPLPPLSGRQSEVLQALARGFTNRDIALQLGISSRSVEVHVNILLEKLGAANRTEAVAIALKKHLLKI